ncbi:uncharacterized protein LOC132628429 [Lycium barbarum]|uniref:uncharacterized protein LOC132628429 n=1 Tax=Lycium barbarum TaxID=112863 RepID=UPI00293F0F67|nr:uncharacterized protein LOC132628429 [Lycium barbarum]
MAIYVDPYELGNEKFYTDVPKVGVWGAQFTSHFLWYIQKELGTQIELSTTFHPSSTFHPQLRLSVRHSMTLFVALYSRRYRSPIGWLDAIEVELIQERLPRAQSKQKRYTDRKVHYVEFMEGERVLLKVSPVKCVMCSGKKDKLISRFICPFEILQRIGEVAYKLALHPSLTGVHPVFHISKLKKYYEDKSNVLQLDTMQVDQNLTIEEESVAILDRQVWKLRSKEIAIVTVQ